MFRAMPFTRKITLLFGGQTDKIIKPLFDGETDTFLDELNFTKLVEILNAGKQNKKEVFDNLLKYIEKQTEWFKVLRALMLLHKLIHNQGDELEYVFSSEKTKKLLDYKMPRTTLRKNEEHIIPSHYFLYLQKLVYNYSDLEACFSGESEVLSQLQKNNMSVLHLLSKVQNTLTHLLKILPLFEASVVNANCPVLVKQAAYFCFTDCYHYYTYINHAVDEMIKQIYNLSKDDAVFLYEIYAEHIKLTHKIKEFYEIKCHLKDFYLNVPNFFKFDSTSNAPIEIYINELKKPHARKREKALSIQIDLTDRVKKVEFAHSAKEIRDNDQKSLQDVSENLIRSMSSLTSRAEKKTLFMPPKFFLRRKGPYVAPRLRVFAPRESPKKARNAAPQPVIVNANENLLRVPGLHVATKQLVSKPVTPTNENANLAQVNLNQSLGNQGKASGLGVPASSLVPSPVNGMFCRSLDVTPSHGFMGGSFSEVIAVGNFA